MAENNDTRFPATARIPVVSERQRTLLTPLDSTAATLEDFVSVLYKLAEDEYQSADDPMSSYLKKMVDDGKNDKEMVELIRVIPKQVIRTIITGTLGYHYKRDPNFASLFLEIDECAGTYLNTFVLEGKEGRGLRGSNWRLLQNILRQYIRGRGHVIGIDSTPRDRADAAVAHSIETIWLAKDDRNVDSTLEFIKKGERQYATNDKAVESIEKLCVILEARIRNDLDPDDNIRQHQAPCQVGCSKRLSSCVSIYDTRGGLQEQSKDIWGLVMSCLKYMGLRPETICVPIVKTWKNSHFHLAEILITFLGGTMVEHGGMNSHPPGTHSIDEPRDYHDELRQNFIDKNLILENLAHSMEIMAERKEQIDNMLDFAAEDPTSFKELRELESAASKLHDERLQLQKALVERNNYLESEIARLDELQINIIRQTNQIEELVSFSQELDEWLADSNN